MTGLSDSDAMEALFRLLPSDGRKRSNPDLMKTLGWEKDFYWKIRDLLVSEGRAEIGKGYGGSLFCVTASAPAADAETAEEAEVAVVAEEIKTERQLYGPMRAA